VICWEVTLSGSEIEQHGQSGAKIMAGSLADFLAQNIISDRFGANLADRTTEFLRKPAQPIAQIAQMQGADRAFLLS
jgi:hypothetical protein